MAVVILLIENIQMLSIYTQKLNDFEYDQFLNHIRNFIDYFRSCYFIIYQILHDVWKFNQPQNYICYYWIFIGEPTYFITAVLDF